MARSTGGELALFQSVASSIRTAQLQLVSPPGTTFVYGIGGFDGTSTTAQIFQENLSSTNIGYNPAGVTLLTPRRSHGATFVGGMLYVVGGANESTAALDSTEILHL